MSNFNRKIKKNMKNKMVDVYEIYQLETSRNKNKLMIEVTSYNKNFFDYPKQFLNVYGIFCEDFIDYLDKQNGKTRVIDFLQDSVKNNYMLNDSLQKNDFKVEGEHIIFTYEHSDDVNDFINSGEFYIDNYKVNCCSSYMFFEDLLSNEKYIYYGD